MDNEPTWQSEGISWHAIDLYELGYINTAEEWGKFQGMLCDTVQRYLEDSNG
jgi:hypothetical protein